MKKREQIYIIPRWSGMVFAAFVLALFIEGYVAQGFSGLAQTLVICCVVAGIVALFQTNENLRGIEMLSCRSEPVPAGGEVVLTVTLRNISDRERVGLRIRFRKGWALRGDAWLPVLKPGGRATVRIPSPADRRGRFPNPSIWVSSSFPVGLCFSWKMFSGSGEYFVYPRPVGQPLAAVFAGGGGAGAGGLEGVEDISGHRPYAAGDLRARIDWKVFAKRGRLFVKTFEAEGGGRALLRWEATGFLSDPERRLEQMSSWVAECARSMKPFEMLLDSSSRPLNEKNLVACRMALASFSYGPGDSETRPEFRRGAHRIPNPA